MVSATRTAFPIITKNLVIAPSASACRRQVDREDVQGSGRSFDYMDIAPVLAVALPYRRVDWKSIYSNKSSTLLWSVYVWTGPTVKSDWPCLDKDCWHFTSVFAVLFVFCGVSLARRLSRRCGCSRRERILQVYQCRCCVCGMGWGRHLSLVASKWMAQLCGIKAIPLRSNSTRPIRLERKVFTHQKSYKALSIYYCCCLADYFERIQIYENYYPTDTV